MIPARLTGTACLVFTLMLAAACTRHDRIDPPVPSSPASHIVPTATGFSILSETREPRPRNRLVPVGGAIRIDRALVEGPGYSPLSIRP